MYPVLFDHFKKQFAYLRSTTEMAQLVLHLRDNMHHCPGHVFRIQITRYSIQQKSQKDLAKCCIKEIEKPLVDRNCGIPTTKLPIQAPQTIQGAARPAAAETLEQRRMVRNPAVPTQYTAATGCSYPRRNASCKNEREDNEVVEGSNGLQPKPPQYIPRKVTAAQGGSGSQWY
ncbi:hypothetical protein M0R45_020706 [Rubus argutus]|uniref:Uncharacterized protein n=1 Tax=Rubus argutus TaxID=59490 RepID=A0AAW1XBF3_RUBAR